MPHKSDLEKWNDAMYVAHPTPYQNKVAGIIERARARIIKELAMVKKSDDLIEIGCEQGVLLDYLPDCRKKVGLDISEVALKDAKRRLDGRARFLKADAEKPIKLPANSFSVLVCSQTLEHVKNPEAIMSNMKRLSKKNARIVISVPNELFMLRIKTIFKKLGILQWLFPGIEEGVSEWHLQVFTDKKVKELVEDDFEIVAHRRAFNIYLIYLLRKK
ncbi:MAG: 3-demethylubiquinone-9 3-O-methyltransferase [uncultured bacterium]|nr:MAG: 3-demethylubiquinone-9 3-O-methyltransferase [uncultured bacterium]